MSRENREQEDRARGFGLIAWGGLLGGLCGTCTVAVLSGPKDEYGFRELAWVIGGFPTVVGALLVGFGVHAIRGAGGRRR